MYPQFFSSGNSTMMLHLRLAPPTKTGDSLVQAECDKDTYLSSAPAVSLPAFPACHCLRVLLAGNKRRGHMVYGAQERITAGRPSALQARFWDYYIFHSNDLQRHQWRRVHTSNILVVSDGGSSRRRRGSRKNVSIHQAAFKGNPF